MNELALFAGAGGGILGTKLLGWRVVCAVEINSYCREVLLRRQEEGILEPFPIWDDVRTFDGKPWLGKVDVVTAGFPCQPWSVAGQQRGEADERNLWPDTIRIIGEIRPEWVLLENVPALLAHEYFGAILGDLAESRYDARWKVISAAEVGAPHLRKRVWIVAHAADHGQLQEQLLTRVTSEAIREAPTGEFGGTDCTQRDVANPESSGWPARSSKGESRRCGEVANAESHIRRASRYERPFPLDRCGAGVPNAPKEGLQEFKGSSEDAECSGIRAASDSNWWATEPELGRVAHGVAYRVDRLEALGEGQVPAVVRVAWELLRF